MATSAAALPFLLLPLAWLAPSNVDAKPKADPVRIRVYYETLCPDSRRFIVEQLYPVWTDLKDILDVNLNAHGKAKERAPGVFSCQHGYHECKGNMIMTCVKEVTPDLSVQMKFLKCLMNTMQGDYFASECAAANGVNMNEVNECVGSEEIIEMQRRIGEEQKHLNPKPNYVPWILINDSSELRRMAEKDLRKIVCEAYEGPTPEACQEVKKASNHLKKRPIIM